MVREPGDVRDVVWEAEVPQGVPSEGVTTPLTAEEEQRCRSAFAIEIGTRLAHQGWALFPAYTPEERIRLFAVARMIEARLGCRVEAVPEDICSMRFTVVGAESGGASVGVGEAGTVAQLSD